MAFGRVSQFCDRLHHRLSLISGWRRRGLLFALGAATVLGLPPANLWPVAFLTLPPLVWLLESATRRRDAFATGWWFAFGYLTTGLYWISNALLVFSADLWWMVPFALVGLPAMLAIYYGLALLAVHCLTGTDGDKRLARVLAIAAAFSAADMLRGVLFTGFPWNTFGALWSGVESLSQGVSVIGIYGVGVLVLIAGALPALILSPRLARSACLAAIAIPLLSLAGGMARLASAPDLAQQQADITRPGLRMVQANIPQREKWSRSLKTRNFERNLNGSQQDRPDWITAVIWPETAAAFPIERAEEEAYRLSAAAYAAPPGGYLLTGTIRWFPEQGRVHNGMVALNPQGTVLAHYDKAHLVPFGEYVPFSRYLPIDKITAGATDFTPGPGPQTLFLPGLPPVSVLICYEVIFPGAVTDPDDRPGWLLNITNDAWYGRTAGPYQHYQHARMRAIEEGLPLVRPANTGISIAFDGYGRELGRIALEQEGHLDFRLPEGLAPTVFSRLGNAAAVLMTALLLIGAIVTIRR